MIIEYKYLIIFNNIQLNINIQFDLYLYDMRVLAYTGSGKLPNLFLFCFLIFQVK